MTYDILGLGALDYMPCRYGTSKLQFRGPERRLEDPYVAFLGGTATFGKFIEQPYPLKVEHLTGVSSVNFGQVNAGLDVFLKDPVVMDAARRARVTVIEVLGAANLSNRFYRVHPRRNDRFLRAGPLLRRLYPEVDFSQFNFTHHMLGHLYRLDRDRFAPLCDVLQKLWIKRMRRLVAEVSDEVVLVRFREAGAQAVWSDGSVECPALVTDDMLDLLAPDVSAIVEVSLPHSAQADRSVGMVYGVREEQAAKAVPSPQAHAAAALALRPVLDRLM
jgi:hypothetical protein